MFSRQKVTFTPSDAITHLVVSNNLLVLAMANQRLLRIDLQHPDQFEGWLFFVLLFCVTFPV